jgi:signal transduction histidine kinase/DNA-binding response OmpR family regulator
MGLTLRAKLIAIVAVNALALMLMIAGSSLIEQRVDRELQSIQDRYVPRIGLRPRLEGSFDRVTRSLQDAADAGDADLLAAARDRHAQLLTEIAAASNAIGADDVAALRAATEAYFATAVHVTQQLIDGEPDDGALVKIEQMQAQRVAAAALIEKVTSVDEAGLAQAFRAAGDAQRTGARLRLVVGFGCLVLILGLSVWIGQSIVRSMRGLTAGLERFGAGEFGTPIPLTTRDELAELSRQANQMAARLDLADRRTQDLLARTQRQASELLEARIGLERKADELARASAYKSKFLASMSHELRTPLNAIIGFSELMHDGLVKDPAKQHEFLGHVLASGRHLLQLINDVLDLSKVEAGKLEFHAERVSMTDIVGEVLAILKATAAQRKVQVQSSVAPEVNEVVLDPARLKQLLYNYVSNALKFTPPDGRVDIRVTAEGPDEVRIEVEDTGVGIAPADLERLFAEFLQVGKDSRQAEGTGLGLVLTKRLVEAQGGSVGVRSEVGKGSVFHAVLPRRSTVTSAMPAIEPPPATAPAQPGARAVLVIEDDPADQTALADALRGAGYEVEVVSSGRAALARASERAFDAITLDLLLPDMSGLELLRRLRADGRNHDVPVIVVTVVAERGAVAGFAVDDVLPKPVDPEVLRATLVRAGVPPARSRVVMVVDDDPAALELMGTALRKLGYETRTEPDGATALRAVQGAPPNAIVLDLIMPGMSGFEFLDQLRGTEVGHDLPVIVWTSKDLSSDEHAMLRASASAVVSKGHGGSAGVVAELSAHLRPRRAE